VIIEQAFLALPELLLGNFYSVQDYEAGIVGVFSMAVLQELNGRNVSHPIRHLQVERRYDPDVSRRADLFVNIKRLMVANRNLSNYGWRHHNWIEAKFYRNKSASRRHATNKTTYQGQLIADLIRLVCLVPINLGDRDINGRYFLHVYDDEPRYYLPQRDWVKLLQEPGTKHIIINELFDESATAKKQFGETLQSLSIQATVTNFVNFPITDEGGSSHYWCILTRFDDFSVTLAGKSFYVHKNRVTGEQSDGDLAEIRTEVSEKLGQTKASETKG